MGNNLSVDLCSYVIADILPFFLSMASSFLMLSALFLVLAFILLVLASIFLNLNCPYACLFVFCVFACVRACLLLLRWLLACLCLPSCLLAFTLLVACLLVFAILPACSLLVWLPAYCLLAKPFLHNLACTTRVPP